VSCHWPSSSSLLHHIQGRGDRLSICLSHFLYCADSLYTENEILQAEQYVLKTLDWNMSYLNPLHFLRRVSKADEYDVKAMNCQVSLGDRVLGMAAFICSAVAHGCCGYLARTSNLAQRNLGKFMQTCVMQTVLSVIIARPRTWRIFVIRRDQC
jgi:hypothetical protein